MCLHWGVSPVGRPACSAGPKQVEDLHRAFGSRPFGQDQERRNADQHSAEVKDSVSLSRSSGENAGRAEHEMRIECFARWAPSLFSWTEAGRGPAPSLRLPALRAESGTAECGPAFRRGQGQSVLVAVQRRKRWSCGARNIHQSGICWLRQCSAPPSRMMSKQSMVSTFRLGNAAPIRSQARASRRSSR